MFSNNSITSWRFHIGLFVVFIMTLVLIFNHDTRPQQSLPPPIQIIRKAPSQELHITPIPLDVVEINTEKKREIQKQIEKTVTATPALVTVKNSVMNQSLYTVGTVGSPSVYLTTKGGMGNQLFQYACHYALARKNNWRLYTSLSQAAAKKNRSFNPWERDFALDLFNVPLFPWNTADETWNVSEISWIGDSGMLSGLYPKDKVISQGGGDYCQSEAFFRPYKEEILKMFTLKEVPDNPIMQDWLSLINSSTASVAIHIRRGDFIPINVSVPISFQKNAMDKLSKLLDETPTFFIFTDDVPFVEKEFQMTSGLIGINGSRIHLVSKSKLSSLEEFYLLSRCKHDIIPNSSFGWWAAYLNPNPKKIVIAAHQNLKLFDSMFEGEDMANTRNFNKFMVRNLYYPYEWITVDPF